MRRARNTLKRWFDKHYPKIPPLSIAALATIAIAGCGSSQTTTSKPAQPSQQQTQQQQRQRQLANRVVVVIGDWGDMTNAMAPIQANSLTADFQKWDTLIGTVTKLKIDLGLLRPYLNTEQQARLDGYTPALTDFQDGARAGASGDYMTAGEKWTGVASSIKGLGELIVSLEQSAGNV